MLPLLDTRSDSSLALNGMPPESIRGALDRILRSRVFVHSHRIRRFLQFVVEQSLAGEQQRLKEYPIGLEVFNRLESFDPRVDSIVRVEARRLRAKLEEYYRTEGREDEVRVELRKGSYIPLFETRRPGYGGYGYLPGPTRRSLIAMGAFTSGDCPSELVSDIARQIAHAVLREGCCQIAAGYSKNGDGPLTGMDANGAPDPKRADYVLEGRVERRGDIERVSVQLLNVQDGSYIWSGAADLEGIENLARNLTRTLVISSGRPENGHLERHRNHNQSFDYYMQGRYQWKTGSPDAVRNSASLFAKAVEKDPSYAAAWSSLSEAMIVGSLFGFQSPREVGPKIMEAARKAEELNPGLAAAHVALGAAQSLFEWDWIGGEREFQRAIQLDAHSPSVHDAYALQLACRGLMGPALLETERALELDPASLCTNFILGWLRGALRKYDQAILQHNLVSQLAPDFPLAYLGLGWAHAGKGMYTDAVAYFTNAGNLLKCRTLLSGCLGFCYAKMGQREDAMRFLAQLTSQPPTHFTSSVSVAAIHAGLGEPDRAFQCLDQAAEAHDCSLPLQLLNPEFDSLRSDPRFSGLLKRIGLLAG